jgi:regulatory protein YycI of two-component signal transduction system YycFG
MAANKIYEDGAVIVVLNMDFAMELMGDRDVLLDFLKTFRDETLTKNLSAISAAYKARDMKAAKDVSHNGKGVSA